jgi:hypothetical protein
MGVVCNFSFRYRVAVSRIGDQVIVGAVGRNTPPARIKIAPRYPVAAMTVKRSPAIVSARRVIDGLAPFQRKQTMNSDEGAADRTALGAPRCKIGFPGSIAYSAGRPANRQPGDEDTERAPGEQHRENLPDQPHYRTRSTCWSDE